MTEVQVCYGFCASPEVIEKAAFGLIDLVTKRDAIWHIMTQCGVDQNCASRKVTENANLRTCMAQVVKIGAVARAWIDAGRDELDLAGVPDMPVGELRPFDGQLTELTYRDACNCLIHADAMWLDVDTDGECTGSMLRMRIPAFQHRPNRVASICLTKFSAAALAMVNECRECTGTIVSDTLVDGLPEQIAYEFGPIDQGNCDDGAILTTTVGAAPD